MKKLFNLLVFAMVAVVVASFAGSSVVGAACALAVVSITMPTAGVGVLQMAIPAGDIRNTFTKMLVAVYKEKTVTTSFLRSFFPAKETMTKEISIEVQRGLEKIAVDVERGTDGNRNTFSKSTEKIFVPPFYWEYLTANDHRLYDVAIGMQNEAAFGQLTTELADDFFKLRQKIERAYELQCSEIFDTGIVQLAAGTNIDFKRKAASLVDLTASPWTVGTNDPYSDLADGAKFIRQVGKAQGSTYNVIMGATALDAFLNNTIVKDRADIRNYGLDAVRAPQRDSVGGSFHGTVSAGAYNFRIWSYPEYYDNVSNVSTPYIDDKKIIILPEAPNFNLSFGAVPQLIGVGGTTPQNGAFLIQDFIDERATAHEMHIKSAGVAIPVAVDQIYTAEVIA